MRVFAVLCVALALLAPLAAALGGKNVVTLTEGNFKGKVLDDSAVWLVGFYAPWCGHCKALTPAFAKVADALKGVAKVGAVDMTQHQSVGAPYGIQGFPTLKLFANNKGKAIDYNGARTEQALVDAVMKEVQATVRARMGGKGGSSGSGSGGGGSSGGGGGGGGGSEDDVVVLTESNFDSKVLQSKDVWLVEFYAPWCGHCKNLAPAWAEAATKLKGKVHVAKVDATVEQGLASKYGVSGYPTITVFQGGEKSDYNGGRSASDIVSYALDLYEANAEPPEVKELTSPTVFKEACEGEGMQACVFAFLPHVLDSGVEGRNQYIATLQQLAEKHRRKPLGWVWMAAGEQDAAEADFGVGGFGFPAVVLVKPSKNKYATMKGSFSADGISDYLIATMAGRTKFADVKAMPAVREHAPWDGSAGELVVDEIPLDELFD